MGNLIAKTSGDIASFMTPAKTNIKSLKVHFSPKQLGTGDPSPENVREIVGWDGVETYKSGKNIAHIIGYSAINSDSNNTRKISNNYGTTLNTTEFSLPDTKLIITQTQYPNEAVYHYQNGYCAVLVDNLIWGQKYNVFFRIDNIINNPLNAELKDIKLINPYGNFYSSIVIDDNHVVFKNVLWKQYPSTVNRRNFEIRICGMSFTLSEFMVTPVDEDDFEYEPYQGNINTIDWSSDVGTIYGGYVDLISGELVETHNIITFDGSDDELITHSSNFNDWIQLSGIPNMKKGSFFSDNSSISNRAKKVSSSSSKNELQILIGANNTKTYVYNIARLDSTVTTDETLRNWFLNNPITFTYPLETPIIHQLTPTQLKSFVGQNNFWSNADYVEIEYDLIETEDIQKCRKKIMLNQPHTESVISDVANFTTNMKAPLKECKVYFNPIQEGSGDPSPDNVRNIIGWDGVNLYKCKKNLVLESSIIDNSYVRGAVTQTGTEIGSVYKLSGYKCTDFIKVLPNTTYTITFTWNNAAAAGLVFYSNAKVEDVISGISMETMKKSPYTFTTPSNCNYIRFTSRYLDSFMGLVQGSTGLTEEIYDGTNIFTTWSDNVGTVYGGYVDLAKGELVATHVIFEKKWNEYSNNYAMTDVNRRSILFPYERRKIGATSALCNIAKPAHDLKNKIHFYIAPENNNIYMFLPKDLDEETLIQVASRIEEPIHYSLTPQQLLTFKGENNIWSDTNEQTEVKFWTH